ncbi:type VI secretion system contractile sheath protein TssC [Chitinophaga sp. Mgbs1]|uniref:Type VI secretion system contractile sheath protein TssC n=1 Tax=Chitinophaga solisilvae TaxID=1233460 RepID=A0A3S1JE74_9BACT|nr:type VI secretion system contractile sheath protein TssC [Chitinophaga solisilvae]
MAELQKNEEQELQQAGQSSARQEVNLTQQLEELAKYGGFDLLEATVEGAQNMNPERKARRNIFLTESGKKQERDKLRKTLSLWEKVLSEASELPEMVDYCSEHAQDAEAILAKNLGEAVEATHELEQSYRNVALFFKNTESDKVKNISFINVELEQLKDLDNTRFIDAVRNELVANYDRLDLRDNYSLLVVPGYLGSNKVIEKWAKIAHENKAMLITDFAHLDAPDDVMEMFEMANLTGGEIHRSNVIMSCNWLVGRGKFEEVGEEDHLYVPPSGALAGKIYKTLMSQVTAGKKFGGMNEVDGVKFELKKSEIASLEKMGLVPMVKEYGKVMAFSAKTLFNGDNLGLQTYSVVRVFDFVTKVLMDFLNRRAFENFNANTRKDLMKQIIRFLDGITGPDKLIEDFNIRRFEQDPIQKDRIHLDIHLKPYFPAKNFLIKMEGQKGDDATDWDTTYEQDK